MKNLHALFLCGSLVVAGCDESVDLGHPPPVLVQTDRNAVAIGAGRLRLQRAIAAIAQGEPSAVRALIRSRSRSEGAATRRLLIRLGLDPVRIAEAPSRAGAAEVVLTRARALTAPCASAIEPTSFGDPGQSFRSLADCNQTNNLAQMVADPADLVAPPPLGPGDGAYLAAGVESWRRNERFENNRQQRQSENAAATNSLSNPAPTATTTTTTMP